jgi:hypothetical protein
MVQQFEDSQRGSYEILREDHQELIQLQIQDKDLSPIYDIVSKPTRNHVNGKFPLTAEERKIYNFYVAEFDLYERVWRVKKESSEEISDAEWIAWLLYLEKMSHHWLFEYTFYEYRKIFDEEVMREIETKVIESTQREMLLAQYEQALKTEKEQWDKKMWAKKVREEKIKTESNLLYRVGLKRFNEQDYKRRLKSQADDL